MEQKSISKTLVIAIVVIIVGVIFFFLPKRAVTTETNTGTSTTTDNSNPISTIPETPGTVTATVPATSSKYKDGTYVATGSYVSPGGPDNLTVSVTLKNDIIVDSTVTKGANDATSNQMQGVFIANYKVLVTGKNIDTVSLSKVSGSSLTSGGFNDALAKIKLQAKA